MTMKRWIAAFLCAVMVLGMVPAQALAVEVGHDHVHGDHQHVQTITKSYVNPIFNDISAVPAAPAAAGEEEVEYQTSIADAAAVVLEQFKARQNTITVGLLTDTLTETELQDVMNAALVHNGNGDEGDYLYWQYGGWHGTRAGYGQGDMYYLTLTYEVTYYTDATQEAAVTAAVDALLAELALNGQDDYHKVKGVYDWLCANVTYDYANLENTDYKLKHTAYAALIDRTSVCQGYAVLLYRLLLELGVDCRLISGIGNGGGHAWNIIGLDGLYYNADATWDAGQTEYTFFLKGDDFGDHVRDAEYLTDSFNTAYPMSGEDYVHSEPELIYEGACGENLTWILNTNGVLRINGTGSMVDFSSSGRPSWYAYQEKIRKIVIAYGITSIGKFAFANCTNVTEVEIPSTVKSIGNAAFSGCSMLEEIEIPDAVTTIGQWAFNQCTELKYVTLSQNLSSLEAYTFNECRELRRVNIPAGISSIGENAFYNCDRLERVVLPDTVTYIGRYAFFDRTGDVCFAGAPPVFHPEAFWAAEFTAYYPSGNEAWTEEAMQGYGGSVVWKEYCSNHEYTEEVVEATCTEGGYTTYTCTVCQISYVGNVVAPYGHTGEQGGVCTVCGGYVPFGGEVVPDSDLYWSLDENGVLTVYGRGFMPDYYIQPCPWAEYLSDIKAVVIADGVITLTDNSFKNCTNLTSVTLCDTLTEIGYNAFENCTSLTRIEIPDSVAKMDVQVFCGCTALTYAKLPAGLTEIEAAMFKNCTALETVVLPESVASIGGEAFSGCSSLKEVVFPDTLTYIDWNAFAYCEALTTVTIPGSVETISSAFRGCTGLQTLTIGFGVKTIHRNAFQGCTSLQSVVIPDSVIELEEAFVDCTALEEVTLSRGITSLTGFSGCTSLRTIVIPEGVISIGDRAFENCSALETVVLPQSLSSLGIQAFINSGLREIAIPAGVTVIPREAFANCSALTSVTLPEGLMTVESNAFRDSGLVELTLPGTLTEIQHGAFDELYELTTLTLMEGITSINGFNYCSNLGTIVLPSTLTIITDAFDRTYELRSLTIPANVTDISGSFWQCYSLDDVYFRGSAPAIDSNSFYFVTGTFYYPAGDATWTEDVVAEPNDDSEVTRIVLKAWCYEGHTYEAVVTDPACTEEGYTTHTCAVCGDSYVDTETEALGHNYESVTTPPTCTEDGWTTYTCTRCGDSYQEVIRCRGEHDYTYVRVDPTCTEAGSITRICNVCGDTVVEEIPAAGHNYSISGVSGSCTEDGYTLYSCMTCGYEYRENVIPAPGHTFGDWVCVNSPTCQTTGEEERRCSVCYAGETREVPIVDHQWSDASCEDPSTCRWCGLTDGDALGHAWSEWQWVNEPTCYHSGMKTRSCTRCAATQNDFPDALGHDHVAAVTEPDCVQGGYTTFTCSRCGDMYVGDYTDPLGHNMGQWVVVTEATCTSNGAERRECTRCGAYESRAIAATGHQWTAATCTDARTCSVCGDTDGVALGHEYGDWYAVTAATCTDVGQERHDCVRCDHYETRFSEPLGHEMSDWYVREDATCERDGTEQRSCTRCGHYETRVAPALGHDYQDVVTAATCEMGGYTTHSCSRCYHSYVDTYTEPLGHDFGQWEVLWEASCCNTGMEQRNCTRCAHSETREIPMTDHDWTAANCETARCCAVCGAKDGEPLGHDMSDWYMIVKPTCTESGEERRDCTRCGQSEYRGVGATGHNYASVVTEPTCTEGGYTTHTCSECNHTYVDSNVDALGHDWLDPTCETSSVCARCGEKTGEPLGHDYGEWIVVTDPTCTEAGQEQRDCTRCDAHETREVAPIGHNYESVATEATCVAGGYTTHICVNCKHSYIDGETEPLGHDYGEWIVVTDPTCTEAGQEQRNCTRCDAHETREVAPIGHNYESVATEATCVAGGYTTHTCTNCGHSYIDGETEPLGHDWQDADCENPQICARCGETQGEALGHNYESVVTEATCVAGGYTTHTCMVCGHSYIDGETEIDPENHVGQEGTECECGVFLGDITVPDGWYAENGLWYYYQEGQKVTGWQNIGGYWYYFNANGAMQSGWLLDGGVWYYLNNHMATGWQNIGGYWYYFNANGAMQSGWLLDGGVWYYLNNHMATGWQNIGGYWYYFNANGAMQSGWVLDGGVWYYLNNHMATGWQQIGGVWYYFNANGAMQSGWLLDGGVWYYLNNHMVTGWQQIGGVWYYFNANGAMQSGWLLDGGKWYYLNNHMITGWLRLGNTWYYLDANGAMVTGTHVIDGVTYYFDASGAWIP